MKESIPSYWAISDAGYQNFGLKKVKLSRVKRGCAATVNATPMRWYLDTHLDEGEKLVIVFSPKSHVTMPTRVKPFISVQYNAPDAEYRVAFQRERDAFNERFVDVLSRVNPLLGFLGKLIRLEGAYIRPAGTVTIEKKENGVVVESVSDQAL